MESYATCAARLHGGAVWTSAQGALPADKQYLVAEQKFETVDLQNKDNFFPFPEAIQRVVARWREW